MARSGMHALSDPRGRREAAPIGGGTVTRDTLP